MTKVELFERIRIDHHVHGKSIRRISRERRVHRRMVRQAILSAIPPARKKTQRPSPILGPLHTLIDQWLMEDVHRPRKQRHTARRIWQRLRDERACTAAESTVRGYVQRRRRELGLGAQEVFVPQEYAPGEEAEVDFYEADVDFPDGTRRVHVFVMRACFSGREFHIAFPRATQDAFILGHVEAFAYFGGVFSTVRYDNLSAAVKKVLRGRRREETARFVALRSHYLFESSFTQPGKRGAHEKGGVESSVGRFRRAHFVPVPEAASLGDLNGQVRLACARDDSRTIEGRAESVFEAWEKEAPLLREPPAEPFPAARVTRQRIDSKSRIKVGGCFYSVPVRLAHLWAEVRVDALRVRAFHGGRCVADHERLCGQRGERLELDHYLELLRDKPGAMPKAVPLGQARRDGRWPSVLDAFWAALIERHGQQQGTRELVEILLGLRHGAGRPLRDVAVEALELGCLNAASVLCLARHFPDTSAPRIPDEHLGALAGYHRQPPSLTAYDELASVCVAETA